MGTEAGFWVLVHHGGFRSGGCAPQHQHLGIGKTFMALLKAHLEGIGIETIILFTSKDNFPFDFYLRSGFVEMDGMRMMAAGPTE
jgi:N-acetylglutamate synthase-like GNAT family acetyltransferase